MVAPSISVNIPEKKSYSYPIYIAQDLIMNHELWLDSNLKNHKIVVITDDTVSKLYADSFTNSLRASGYDVLLLGIKPGEESKNYSTFEYLLDEMIKYKCDRHSLCIALGGGVVGDITGFVAASFMRGIKYIQVPTTLLSMIDSSVGGKTAINSKYGKNLIGAFYQPGAVLMDINLLKTLPKHHVINGLIEAIKIFITNDAGFFDYVVVNLEQILNLNDLYITNVIKRAVELKADVVSKDEKEENLRMVLNFGHTAGHAIEKLSNYKISHGYAVALGILIEAKIAVLRQALDKNDYILIETLFSKLGIATKQIQDFVAEDLINMMQGDKKNKQGNIYMVILANIGSINLFKEELVATPVDSKIIHDALISFGL